MLVVTTAATSVGGPLRTARNRTCADGDPGTTVLDVAPAPLVATVVTVPLHASVDSFHDPPTQASTVAVTPSEPVSVTVYVACVNDTVPVFTTQKYCGRGVSTAVANVNANAVGRYGADAAWVGSAAHVADVVVTAALCRASALSAAVAVVIAAVCTLATTAADMARRAARDRAALPHWCTVLTSSQSC